MAKTCPSSQPVTEKAIFDEAVAHHQEGRFQQAEQLYRNLLEVDPLHAEALYLLGLLAYQRATYDQAQELLEKAIQQKYTTPLSHYTLGLVYEKTGQLDEARQAYQQALHRKPDYVEAHNNLGNVCRDQGDLDAAIVAYKRAITIKPDYAAGYNNLGVALKEQHDLNGAIEAYQQALRCNPDNAESHYNLGMVFVERGHLEEAALAFQKAIEIKPDYAKACHHFGLVLLWQGQRDAALFQFRKSADLLYNHGRSVTVHVIYPSRITHEAEQLDYLHKRGVALQVPVAFSETLHVLKQHMASSPSSNQPIALSPSQAQALAPSFNRILHYADNPVLPDGALNLNLDREDIQQRYQARHPEMCSIDGLLNETALKGLRRFCLESTIWKKDYAEGYVGAFFNEGFASPLLLQVAEELRQQFSSIFHHHQLLHAWAFKQDSQRRPLKIHADAAAVNVNFWITPNEANLDLSCGGLTVWDKEAPKDWDFTVYNNSKYQSAIREFLHTSGASPVTVPYRENRALIFNSNLFHESDRCLFRHDYESRRINITFLYGHRVS